MQFATEGQTGDCDPEANLLSLFIHKTKSNFYATSKLVEFTTLNSQHGTASGKTWDFVLE
jgi:hypothetical protein